MKEKLKHILALSELIDTMRENGATEEELLNVAEFFKAVINTELECDSIYEFEVLDGYRIKYFN